MSITLFIISIVLALVGIIGLIFPIIPASIISFGALLVYYFTDNSGMTLNSLIIWGVIMVVVSLVDNFVSPLIVKKYGGSKKALTGSIIGLLLGSFIAPPLGMIVGGCLGAFIGEALETKNMGTKELRVAFGSFVGFLASTGIKLMYAIAVLVYLCLGE